VFDFLNSIALMIARQVIMNITIREVDNNIIQHAKKYGSSFEVRSKLVLRAENAKISYTIENVSPYKKQYGTEEFDPRSYTDGSGKIIFFAYADGKLAGQIRLQKHWNEYAYIDDIAVEPEYRGQGVGRALLEHAIAWARAKGFPGMMLETQDNNVLGCRLYASCGFELRGFDTHLYKGLDPSSDEIALYWYLIF
jgi:ribosomal protein S18 acetylase RimI-like enzyme